MDMILNRLQKNERRLRKWVKDPAFPLEAYRIYDRDIPEYPFIIDLYKDHAVVFEKGSREVPLELQKLHRQDIRQAIEKGLSIPALNIIFKERVKHKGGNPHQLEEDHQRPLKLVIKEGRAQFLVNLTEYLDTGLFLDHRPLRRRFSSHPGLLARMKVLNLFSYTGALGVAAALAGATTTNVDMSPVYQDWARANYDLNQLNPRQHRFITANALEFLVENEEAYDLIFLDPPTFSNSKKMKEPFEVEKDHLWMIHLCMNRLTTGGTLIFSNNKRSFRLDPSLAKTFQVEDITALSIPPDFRDPKIHHCLEIKKGRPKAALHDAHL